MNEDIMTVKQLRDRLDDMIKRGEEQNINVGDYKIVCLDNYLHCGETGIDYVKKEFILRGHLFNVKVFHELFKLNSDIKKRVDKFYKDTYRED